MLDDRQPEGRIVGTWIAIGVALFTGIGVSLSISTDNPGLIGIGPAVGTAVGVAIGTAAEQRARREGRIRPLTAGERRQQRWALWAGLGLLVVGVALLLLLMLLR